MKSVADAVPGSLKAMLPLPSPLRIAIPAWRMVGINMNPAPVDKTPVLSREEIQSLFHGELAPRTRRTCGLTAREEQERSLARRIRSALYPQVAETFLRQ